MAGGNYSKAIYNDYVLLTEKYNKVQNDNKDLQRRNAGLNKDAQYLRKQSEELREKLNSANRQMLTMFCFIQIILKDISELQERFDKLFAEHYKNSSNSSLSPSTDTPQEREQRNQPKDASLVTDDNEKTQENGKENNQENDQKNNHSNDDAPSANKEKSANEYNGRTKTGRTCGKQKGAPSATLTKETVNKLLTEKGAEHRIVCQGNMGPFNDQNPFVTHWEVDFKIVPVVTEIRHYYEKELHEPFYAIVPELFRSSVSYGSSIRSLCVYLSDVGSMPVRKIRDLINEVLELPVSEGSVYNYLEEFGEKTGPALESIRNTLSTLKVLCTDAAYISLNGKMAYIRVITSGNTTFYYPMKTKTLEELSEEELLREFQGVLIHDHETTLYHFGKWHQECLVHLGRYIAQCEDLLHHNWCGEMKGHLYDLEETRQKEGRPFSEKEVGEAQEKYFSIIQKGWKENETADSKYYKSIEAKLLRRLEKYADSHLLFLKNLEVPISNNVSLCELLCYANFCLEAA